jgi:thiol:disulfide interchange protein
MHSSHFRRWAAAGSALLVALVLGTTAFAADAQPARKDSPARAKPRNATLTPSVVPAEARPGDTVEYRVTAKLDPGVHIYTHAKKQPEAGPRQTLFDFFDKGGLEAVGDWKASKEATTRKEPAFPELESVSFYEDEVTWSHKLQVPADAAPGKRTLRCQAEFQVCSNQNCSFPGRWTLPDVSLTILPGDSKEQVQAAPPAPATEAPAPAQATKPAKPDRPGEPDGVSFSTAIIPAEAKPGQAVQLQVTAKIAPPWHIYSLTQPDERRTEFDLFDAAGLEPAGPWTMTGGHLAKTFNPAAGPLAAEEAVEGEAVFSIPLRVPADAAPGAKAVKCQVSFQICTDKMCMPGRKTLPAAVLTVSSGGPTPEPAVAVAAAPPATKAEPPAPAAPEAKEDGAGTASKAAVPAAARNDVEKALERGILPLLALSIGAGLLALVMPCVWPMVPITVNFFVKQGQKGKSTTGLAITYCLSIIGIFTLVGVVFSAVFGASAVQNLATNFWLNAFVALLFLAFGLSLLGLFEFRLPTFLLNASAQGESRGGLIGVVFMALTLTITSFTCTFPVVGGLLVIAAGGSYFYPIVGLATFATVLALPFFLLALAPGLLAKMPRSGDWMNAVKVVGGLVELGAAFKFVNNAELGLGTIPEDCWFNAPTVLTIWVVLALICGIYLLGLFRTDHDLDAVKVGPMRMLLGSFFLFFCLYLTPALFGRPLPGQLWGMVVGLLPPDIGSLKQEAVVATGDAREAVATDSDPAKAVRQQKSVHGVQWGLSYEEALERAKAENRPILIDFTGVFCPNCRQMEQFVMPRPEVVNLLKKFVTVQLYTDTMPIKTLSEDDKERLAVANQDLEMKLVRDRTNPFYVVLNPRGEVLASLGGSRPASVFADFLKEGLSKFGGGALARAEVGAGGR